MQQVETARGHVMVVDDDEFFLESVSTNLADAGYRTDSFWDISILRKSDRFLGYWYITNSISFLVYNKVI